MKRGRGERERPREKVNIGLAHISYIFSHLDGPTSDGPSSIIQEEMNNLDMLGFGLELVR